MFVYTKIPLTLLAMGSTALAVAAALPRVDPNFPRGINEVLKPKKGTHGSFELIYGQTTMFECRENLSVSAAVLTKFVTS